MKKLIAGFITGCLALTMATSVMANNANYKASFIVGQNSYTADGQVKQMDATTFVENGRTYVPIRYLGYALGVDGENIGWQDPNATLVLGDTTVRLTMGSKQYQVNGQSHTMDVTPINRSGRIYLPARFVAESFGYEVGWDNAKRAVLIGPKGDLPSLPVIDLAGQGEPAANRTWGPNSNYSAFRDANTKIVYKSIDDLTNQSFKVGKATTILGMKITKDNITVTVAIPEMERFGGDVYLYENDNVVRVRQCSPRPADNKDPVYDFKYPVFAGRDEDQGFTPKTDITKVEYIFLNRGDTIIAFDNPLYQGK